MIKGVLFGLSLVVNAAFEPYQPQLEPEAARLQMSVQQKNAVIQPLLRTATDCIVRAVARDPKFQATLPPGDINELIVSSMEGCVEPMRAMIDAHDRLFGEGTGEAFFMGPYLEILPKAVTRQVKGSLPQN
ncbi:MAG TPA: hypothetical protein VFK79_07295 [Xanthobacteraceae bacterium]|nr:hypothetical protein [Xanthobacteraceae bacterium]